MINSMDAYDKGGYFKYMNNSSASMEEECESLSVKMEDDMDDDDQLRQEYDYNLSDAHDSLHENAFDSIYEQDRYQTGLDQLPPKQRAMYNAFKKDFDRHFDQDDNNIIDNTINIQNQLSKIPIHHQRYVQTHLVMSPSTNIIRSNLLRHLLHSLSFIQQLQGKINCFSRLKKTVHYNNFFVFYDQLQQQYRMSSTEFVQKTKHLFNEGDDGQIKRRIIRYRKLGERVNGIIVGYDKVILLFPDMMTKPRMEDLTDVTYNMICRYVQPKLKPMYSIPALQASDSTVSSPQSNQVSAISSPSRSSSPVLSLPPISIPTPSHTFTIADLCSQS
ncbi:unnamed protein product [Absidia cylindrospora]